MISGTCRNNNTTPTIENLAGTNTLAGTNFAQVGGTNFIYQSDAGPLLITGPIQYVGSLTAGRMFTFTGAGNTIVSSAILNSTNGAPIGLIKNGTGTVTLGGVNAYANGTTILGGTLAVNGALANGRVLVSSGILGGTGVIAGPVTVSATATLLPGTHAVGSLHQ